MGRKAADVELTSRRFSGVAGRQRVVESKVFNVYEGIFVRNIVFWSLAWTGFSAAVIGCNGPEPLTPYKVAKPRRMLVSTLVDLENNNAWFIKLDGPTTVVNRHEASFATLLDSIALTEG